MLLVFLLSHEQVADNIAFAFSVFDFLTELNLQDDLFKLHMICLYYIGVHALLNVLVIFMYQVVSRNLL